jgi:hypothetical protein
MKFLNAVIFSFVFLASAWGQPTNQAWLNASKLAIGSVPASRLGTNDAVASDDWILVRKGNKTMWADPSGISIGGVGTVTSVAMTVPSVFSLAGSPITTSGTLALTGANSTGFMKDVAGTLSWTLDLSAATALNASSLSSGTVPTARLASIPNSSLANSSITVSGTANQVTVSGSPVSLGGTVTLSTPQDIGTGSTVLFANVKASSALQAVVSAELNSIVLTNEQRIVETAWGNGATGAYDVAVPLQTYAIAAASAISSVSNARTTGFANYSEMNITNSSGGDLTMWLTASGVKTPDGSRSVVCTNNQCVTLKFETSAKGVWVFPIRHF